MKRLHLLAFLAFGACAHRIDLPMTSRELAAHPGAPELVAYLGQPDADPQVCAESGTAAGATAEVGAALVDALRDGGVAPGTAGTCLALLFARLDARAEAQVAGDVVRAVTTLATSPRLEQDPALRARLEALGAAYRARPPGRGASDAARDALEDARRQPLAATAQRVAGEVAVALELERGRWAGRPVDAAAVQAMADDVGVALLALSARRLPEEALRAEAARLAVRQRIAASPYAEVHAAAAEVERAVLERGGNAVQLSEHRPLRASLDASALPARTVVVRQRPLEHAATLLGGVTPDAPPSVLPPLPLRGALRVELAGVSRPITICAGASALDPTPCLAASDVVVASPLAQVRPSGDLRLEEHLTPDAVDALARRGGRLRIPLAVDGAPAGGLDWPVRFERPPELVLAGDRPGEAGPTLEVTVERLDAARVAFRVEGAGTRLSAVVEVAGAAGFRVVSRGAAGRDGFSGSDGLDGTSGFDGSAASCMGFDGQDGSRGGDGGDGADGGDGGPGGPGGEIHVSVISPAPWRDATLALARASVASDGGPGGRGGQGGRGGRGGAGGQGGAGATCSAQDGHVTTRRGGSPGSSGQSGRSGRDGLSGARGASGPVRIDVASR